MIERVLLVAWKGSAATGWVELLQSGGYTVLLEDTTGERAWRTAKERGIDAVIIDGQKKPSHGRQTGHALRDTAKTRNIPIIWTNLDNEDAASVATDVKPDLTLSAPTSPVDALEALRSLSPGLREEPAPVEPALSVPPPPIRAVVPAPPPIEAPTPAHAPKAVVHAVVRTESAKRAAPVTPATARPKVPAKAKALTKPAAKTAAARAKASPRRR